MSRSSLSLDTFAVTGVFNSSALATESRQKRRKQAPPFSLRFTPEERKRLDKLRGNLTLGSYIRKKVLGDDAEPRRQVREPSPDYHMLALILAELGKTRLSNNINQLAKAANMGELETTPETEECINQAYEEIQAFRLMLIAALGIKPKDGE